MSYVYLATAIIGEFLGTTFLKMSDGFTKLSFSTLSLVAYGLCFFFLARSLDNLDLSLAYAVWSGVGIILATAISVFYFKESINLLTLLGIALILVGVVIVNLFGASH
ncbi:multidrug efflux SMR transporter [uncultured Ligilactobacillus sp.]|uniref:DMT family transporter n=1 Tax=uncultured Ligilactobacillus sp. TaxID=2837633 RepID=UPI002729C712|nr:multidrug efflux SMR transporter [uncultured Ligilactobacillus sp.]